MTQTFIYDDYETACAAMAFIDAAIEALEESPWPDDIGTLTEIRNNINEQRRELLKPFGDKVHGVAQIGDEHLKPVAS